MTPNQPDPEPQGIGFQGEPIAIRRALTRALAEATEAATTRTEWIAAYRRVTGASASDADEVYRYTQQEA